MHAEQPSDAAIEVRGLVRKFKRTDAVDGLNLRVEPGRCYGFFGRNGAGKTTTIKCLLNLIRPTAGTIKVFGLDPATADVAVKSRLAYVPDFVAFYPWMTVRQALDYCAAFRSRWNVDTERALLDQFRLDQRQKTTHLSKGQRTQLALIAAICPEPELLVLDEPTSGVDPLQRARLWETIRATASDGAGVLVTTHHLSEAEQCDRLIVLASGRVVAAGTLDEVVGDATAVEVRTPTWEAAFAALDLAGLPVSLVGRTLRVPGADPDTVRRLLADAGVPAQVATVAASFEETFVVLAAA